MGVLGLIFGVAAAWIFLEALPTAAQSSVGSSATTASSGSTGAPPALQTLSSCLESRHQLLVDFLIDTSSSLRQLDPSNERVAAAQQALVALRSLQTEYPGAMPPSIQIAINGYSVDVEPVVSWTLLDAGSLPGLQQQLAQFSTRNTGIDSDYYAALVGVKEQLDQQAASMTTAGGEPPCQAVMWFSGSSYIIRPRDTAGSLSAGTSKSYAPGVNIQTAAGADSAVQDGMAAICSSGGVADQIHKAGIVLVAFQLTHGASVASEDFLQSVVEGSGGTQTCGNDGSLQTGAYIPSYNLSDLAFIFDQSVQEIGGGNPTPTTPPVTVCSSLPCAAGTKTFDIPAFLYRFHISYSIGAEGIDAILENPKGQQLSLGTQVSATQLGSASVTVRRVSPTVGSIDVRLPANTDDWVGQWSLVFVDPNDAHLGTQAQAQLTVFGDLTARLLPGQELTAGTSSTVSMQLVTVKGNPVTPPAGVALVGAALTNPVTQQGALIGVSGPNAQGLYSFVFPTPLSGATSYDLLLEVTVTTNGVAIAADRQYLTIPVNLGPTFPQIKPPTLAMASVLGHEPSHATLDVRAQYGGCIAFSGTDLQATPPGVTGMRVTSSPSLPAFPSCLRLNPKEQVLLRLTFKPSAQGEGELSGTLRLSVRSSTGLTVQRSTPFEFPMRVQEELNPTTAIWLLLLGIVGPLALLYLLSLLGLHFEDFDQLRYIRATLRISGSREQILVDGLDAVEVKTAEIFNRPPSLRRFELSPFTFYARMPRSPLGAVSGRVTSNAERVVTSRGLWRDGIEGVVPLGLGRLWVVAVQPDALTACLDADLDVLAHTDLTLLVLLKSSEDPSRQLTDALEQVNRQLADVLVALVAKLPGPPPGPEPPAPTPEWSILGGGARTETPGQDLGSHLPSLFEDASTAARPTTASDGDGTVRTEASSRSIDGGTISNTALPSLVDDGPLSALGEPTPATASGALDTAAVIPETGREGNGGTLGSLVDSTEREVEGPLPPAEEEPSTADSDLPPLT